MPLTWDDGVRWLMHHFIPDCNSLTTSGHYWIPMKFPWYPWSHVDESQWVWRSPDFTWSTTHRQKSVYLYIYELIYEIGANVERTLMVHSWWILLMSVILCLTLQCHEEVGSFVFLEKCLNNNWTNVKFETDSLRHHQELECLFFSKGIAVKLTETLMSPPSGTSVITLVIPDFTLPLSSGQSF